MATTSLPSPYTPGEAPPVLAGRRTELEAAEADLALMATYGRFLGRVQVEIGSRGVGKTSLLKAIREAALEAGAVSAWATARNDESLIAALVAAVTDGLAAIGVDLTARTPVSRRLRTLSVELGVGPAKAGVEVDLAEPAAPGSSAASRAFGEFVTKASTAARGIGSAGICLLIDEIQAAPRADLRTLAYAWQELQNAPDAPAAVVFAAGLPNAPDVLTAAVTFSERFAFRTLARLDDADATSALEEPADRNHVTWAPELLAAVLTESRGYPYFLQLWGDAVWRIAQPHRSAVLGADLLDAARVLIDRELDTMFRARWAKAAPGERRLLGAMAERSNANEDPVKRAEIAEVLGVTSNDLSVPRRSLLDKGLIEVAARGTLRFTVPGFAAFVRDEVGE